MPKRLQSNHLSSACYAIFIFCGLLVLSACHPHQTLTVTTPSSTIIQVTDTLGHQVTLTQPAKRIVVLFEASLDDLYMLGASSAIIGIPAKIYHSTGLFSAYSIIDSRIKERKIATPSSWEASTNLESIIALQPDLVIINSSQRDVIELLKQMNIAVYAVQSENLMQTQKELLDLGQLTGTSIRATQLVAFITQEIQAMHSKSTAPPKRVYYAWSGGRIFSTSGRNSMPNSIMTLAGTENIIRSEIDQPSVNPEHLLEWDPDIILLWNSDPQQIYQRPELQFLTAVKNKAVFSLSPSFLFNPHTPKILLAANQLHHWVNPSQLNGMTAENDQKRILTVFYGPTIANQLLQLAKNS